MKKWSNKIILISLGLIFLPLTGIAQMFAPPSIKIQFLNPAATDAHGASIDLPQEVKGLYVDPKSYHTTYKKDEIFHLVACNLSKVESNTDATAKMNRHFDCHYRSDLYQDMYLLNPQLSDTPEISNENLVKKGWILNGNWYQCYREAASLEGCH